MRRATENHISGAELELFWLQRKHSEIPRGRAELWGLLVGFQRVPDGRERFLQM